jgi:raffinose/stachyose/melibiose transport system substrate-binding protein
MRLSGRTFVAAIGATLFLAACAPGDDDSDDASDTPSDATSTDEPDASETEAGELGKATLVVWDQEVRGGQADQIQALNDAFEEQNPNVTIERVSRSTDDLRTTLRVALSGDEVPDVVQANNSRSEMGQYVGAGLLTPLDTYAEEFGWTERFPDSVRAQASYTDDGSVLGDGSLYGLSQMGEMVGVFYNKSKLADLDLEVPTTTEDFVEVLEAAKGSGEIPIQFGNSEPWAGIHEYGFVQNQFVDGEAIRDLGFGRPGSSWTSPENEEAANEIVSWVDAEYFSDGFNGIDYDTAWQTFATGEGLFFVGGTWLIADLTAAMGDDVGFFLPPAGASGQQLVTGGISIPFAIPEGSENKDAAAAYIDFITSSDAMATVAESGNLPVIDSDQQEATGLLQEVFDAWATAGDQDLVVPYLDWSTETFYDTASAGIQSLLGGQMSSADFLEALEADYSAATS